MIDSTEGEIDSLKIIKDPTLVTARAIRHKVKLKTRGTKRKPEWLY